MWVDLAPEVEGCGNVGVAVGGVVAGGAGDGGRMDGIGAVAEEDLDICRFGGDGDSAGSAEATGPVRGR